MKDDNIDGNVVGQAMSKALEEVYAVPPIFWSTLCARIQGFFGCDAEFDSSEKLAHCSRLS